MPAARRDAGVALHRVSRDGLQQVKDVKADDPMGVAERVGVDLDEIHVAAPPQMGPGEPVSLK